MQILRYIQSEIQKPSEDRQNEAEKCSVQICAIVRTRRVKGEHLGQGEDSEGQRFVIKQSESQVHNVVFHPPYTFLT